MHMYTMSVMYTLYMQALPLLIREWDISLVA
jgi:hypothetical protein